MIFKLAEVPGVAWVSLRHAECLLFCKQFSNMRPSALEVRGPGSKLHQNLPWTGGDVRAKFNQNLCRGMDFHLPITCQQTDKQTYVHPFLYI